MTEAKANSIFPPPHGEDDKAVDDHVGKEEGCDNPVLEQRCTEAGVGLASIGVPPRRVGNPSGRDLKRIKIVSPPGGADAATASDSVAATSTSMTWTAMAIAATAAGTADGISVGQEEDTEELLPQEEEMSDLEDPASTNLHRLASVLLNQHLQSPSRSTSPVIGGSPLSSPPLLLSPSEIDHARLLFSAGDTGADVDEDDEKDEKEREDNVGGEKGGRDAGIGSKGLELVVRLLRLGGPPASRPPPPLSPSPSSPPPKNPAHQDSLSLIMPSPNDSSGGSGLSPIPRVSVEGPEDAFRPVRSPRGPGAGNILPESPHSLLRDGERAQRAPGRDLQEDEGEEDGEAMEEEDSEEGEGEEAAMTKMPLPFAPSVAGLLVAQQHPQSHHHHRIGNVRTINSAHSRNVSSESSVQGLLRPTSHHNGRKHKSKPPLPPVPRAPMELLWGGPGADAVDPAGLPSLGASVPPLPARSAKVRSRGPPNELADVTAVARLVVALRYEDPKQASPRMSTLVAAFRSSPDFRLPMIQAITQASHDRIVELGAVSRELMAMEKDLKGAMHRDHGVGLAELLSNLVVCIREEMGLRSPELLTDEEEEEEGAGLGSGGMEAGGTSEEDQAGLAKAVEGNVDEVDPEILAATAWKTCQEGPHKAQEEGGGIAGGEFPECGPEESSVPLVGLGQGAKAAGRDGSEDRGEQWRGLEAGVGPVRAQGGTPPSIFPASALPCPSEAQLEVPVHGDGDAGEAGRCNVFPVALRPGPQGPARTKPLDSSSLGAPESALSPAIRWEHGVLLLQESLMALGMFLRAHSRRRGSSANALDKAEMEHIRDAVTEMIAAYPPTALRIVHLILRAWPCGHSAREMGFLQLLGVVLTVAPPLFRLDPRTNVLRRAVARLTRCLESSHAGVAEEALVVCSQPRVISSFSGAGALGGDGGAPGGLQGRVHEALVRSSEGHWSAEVRQEARRLRDLLAVVKTGSDAEDSLDGIGGVAGIPVALRMTGR